MTVYKIEHAIVYKYDRPVNFATHIFRLCPRSDAHQTTTNFELVISPPPQHRSECVDLDGNRTLLAWFDDRASNQLEICARSTAIAQLTNPFNYLLNPWATTLPIDYPQSLRQQLQPYLTGYLSGSTIDPIAAELAGQIWSAVDGDTLAFLSELNRQIYQNCQYLQRDTGAPLPPGLVWQHRCGSCRDLAVLFIEVCRSVGLAGRFVSGYEAGAESEERHLHAWAEIYLPGGGWRGYDPTHGLLVADGHIALAASPYPAHTNPVEGKLQEIGSISNQMSYHLAIEKTSDLDNY